MKKLIAFNLKIQDGLGKLQLTRDGVRLAGDAFALNDLYAKHIRSLPEESLRVVAQNTIKVQTANQTRMSLGAAHVTATANQMLLRSPAGQILLVADEGNVLLTTGKLRVNSE